MPDLQLLSVGGGAVTVVGELDDARRLIAVRIAATRTGWLQVTNPNGTLFDQTLPDGTVRVVIPIDRQPSIDDVSHAATVRWP